ncbi:manganese transport system ATP-binding protein [Pseudonocardia ammonioxydans]|uniref:Manganese transport system ATP-binding protein n=1 Tax=Pseudonocardia ammonioxydans TaxID=260086 RepID=A0A1I4Z822_PSUAM|nr:metal ABC transporter ATP-binding protein [Pseudonocardia ammonioxydans]SFN46435.1 manganese transport system ATP-binding protein [Pseudonocardia ammonioxydans]
MTALEIAGLTVRHGEVLALDDVSLRLGEGTVCGLMGANGSGKSTLFRAVMGLVRPVSGTVRVLGATSATARRRAAVAYMPQAEAIDPDFPILAHQVVLTGRYAGMGTMRRARPADRAAVEAALDRVGLTGYADRQIGRLSGGQRKRVFLARAIAQDAPLLLLDEPFAGVDHRTQEEMTGVLGELAAAGRTVLVSTHDVAGVSRLCGRVVLLAGRLLADGTPDEVLTPEVLGRVFGLRNAS